MPECPLVLLFVKHFGPLDSLRSDLLDYIGFPNVIEEYEDEKDLIQRIETCGRNVIIVASAESCYSNLGSLTLPERQFENFLGLILFCGPHEEFYAR